MLGRVKSAGAGMVALAQKYRAESQYVIAGPVPESMMTFYKRRKSSWITGSRSVIRSRCSRAAAAR